MQIQFKVLAIISVMVIGVAFVMWAVLNRPAIMATIQPDAYGPPSYIHRIVDCEAGVVIYYSVTNSAGLAVVPLKDTNLHCPEE